jgi:Acyl-CoA synthetases (AMP-forming)/AMP-acid ligases II
VKDAITNRLHTLRTLAGAGLVTPVRPDKLLRIAGALRRFGPTVAAGCESAAVHYPDEPALIDELGTLSFSDLHRRTNALAHSLSDAGVLEGDGVAIMCATTAASSMRRWRARSSGRMRSI